VRLTLSITADRYQTFLEAIRQLSGTTVTEERMASIGREPLQAIIRLPVAHRTFTGGQDLAKCP